MKSSTHWILQILLAVVQVGNYTVDVTPSKYKPLIAFAVGIAQAGIGLYNHYYTPQGTRIAALLLAFLIPAGLFAQTPTPTPPSNQGGFSLHAQALALPGGGQTVEAANVGGTFAITSNLSLRSDNILAPANNFQAYTGGVQYFLSAAKILRKTNLDPKTYQFYLTGSVGIARVVPIIGPDKQHIALLAGGGINYSPGGNGKFSVNLIEVRYAKLPGLANNTAIVSSGLKLNF